MIDLKTLYMSETPLPARAETRWKTSNALFRIAAILGVVGFVAASIGGSVFTMKDATPLVEGIGMICFLGFLPILFLAALLGAAVCVYRRLSGKR